VSQAEHWASSVAVSVTCKDFDKVGYVLDTLGAFSPDTITDSVIEKNVLTKTIRDDNSADMLHLIFDTKVYDASIIFDWGIYAIWCEMTAQTSPKIASTLEKKANKINQTIADSIALIENIES
jgi:hypothetical protein